MTRNVRALLLSGVVGIAGILGSGANTAQAQGFGLYGPRPGFGLSIAVGEPYGYGGGYGYGGYHRGHRHGGYGYGGGYRGYGRGYGGYLPGPVYGGGYGGSSYYYSETRTTTIIHCSQCGGYHAANAPCGGYRPAPYPW